MQQITTVQQAIDAALTVQDQQTLRENRLIIAALHLMTPRQRGYLLDRLNNDNDFLNDDACMAWQMLLQEDEVDETFGKLQECYPQFFETDTHLELKENFEIGFITEQEYRMQSIDCAARMYGGLTFTN